MPVAPVPLVPCEPREMNQRAMMFTISVSTNSTRPAANRADVWIPVDSPNSFAITAASVYPWANRWLPIFGALPITSTTAIVSPIARPIPSIAPPVIPGREYGRTARRIISHRVAPSASAPSLSADGTVAMTSREIADTIGTIMIARIRPAMK